MHGEGGESACGKGGNGALTVPSSVPETVSAAWQSAVWCGLDTGGVSVPRQPGDQRGPAEDTAAEIERDRRDRLADYAVLLIPVSAALALVAFAVRHADLDAELTTLFVAVLGLLGGHLLMRARRQRRVAEHEARRAQRELALRARVAEGESAHHRLVAFSQLAAQLAHEVRNPLSSIVLNAELLEEELHACVHANPEVKRLARAVSAEAERLSDLTNEYLAFARLPHPVPTPQALAPVVDEVARFMREEIERAQIVLTVEHCGQPLAVFDARAIRQVLVNLLRNAIDAVPAGGTAVLRTGVETGHATIDLVDSGHGVPDERREAIFDPFFSTKPQGTGLGLSVARKIAREHGGDLLLMPSASGAWFRLTLPAAASAASAA